MDPAERYIPLFLKLTVYVFLSYFFYEAAITFIEYIPGKPWPFLLNTFRMFTFLPIHEAGHLIFKFFGTTLMFLGGSFWQIAFPLIWFIIALRQRSHVAPFPLFWVGENMMDVSLYIRDAQNHVMWLLGGRASCHDWYNLLSRGNALDSAETIADIIYYLGVIICIGGIIAGIILAFHSFYNPKDKNRMPITTPKTQFSSLEDSLDESLNKKSNLNL